MGAGAVLLTGIAVGGKATADLAGRIFEVVSSEAVGTGVLVDALPAAIGTGRTVIVEKVVALNAMGAGGRAATIVAIVYGCGLALSGHRTVGAGLAASSVEEVGCQAYLAMQSGVDQTARLTPPWTRPTHSFHLAAEIKVIPILAQVAPTHDAVSAVAGTGLAGRVGCQQRDVVGTLAARAAFPRKASRTSW